MRAYYNEIDKYCVEWLRNLIAEGLIADGDVDDRSIGDVRPNDLRGYTQCHFFAGLGGWSGALRLAGWPDHREVWTGSCPCQPFSLAGKQRGFADERHLWPFWRYLIAQRRPTKVYGEQVASAAQWLGLVRGDLEALGYAVGAIPVEAASAGADHLRDRYWFVGDHQGERRGEGRPEHAIHQWNGSTASSTSGVGLADATSQRRQGPGTLGESLHPEKSSRGAPDQFVNAGASSFAGPDGVADAISGSIRIESGRGDGASRSSARIDRDDSEVDWVIGTDGKARRVKSGVRLLAHGVPARVAKLRALGNAIDLRPAAAFIRACL